LEEQFDGCDFPRGSQDVNTRGTGGGQPLRGGKVAGEDDMGDSRSSSSDSNSSGASPLDLSNFLVSRKCYWSRQKKPKYDKQYTPLSRFILVCHRAKKLSYWPKKTVQL